MIEQRPSHMSDEHDFLRAPDRWIGDIPSFSIVDKYVQNYVNIANDHLSRILPDSANPWIPDLLWQELEGSTVALIKKYSLPGQRILDAGVGQGRILEHCLEMSRYGIDISPEYLKQAGGKGISVCHSKIEDMPYVDEMFDMVVTTDVLEHVLDLHSCTKQLLRVLKPDGYLIVRVPYREDLEVYLREDLPYEFIHLRNFDEHSIRLHFQKVFGCRVLETNPVAPYFQGATRFRHRLFPRGDAIRPWLDEQKGVLSEKDAEGLAMMQAISAVSEEDVVDWLCRIREKDPEMLDLVKSHLLMGIDMNVVVQKTSANREGHAVL